jgi:FkbM family methyltransferase
MEFRNADRFPRKPISLGSYQFQLHGLALDDIYWNLVHDDFEPEFQQLCQLLVRPDSVCFDIGANIGVKTLFLSRHCPHGRVIAVEAGPVVAECLAANINVNDVRNAVWYHAAAAGHDGSLRFEEHSAWGRGGTEGSEVEAITLDTLASRQKLDRLDFIKIDIEGGEFPVLQSSIGLINRFDPLVYVEINSWALLAWGDTNPKEFLQWICRNFRHVYALNKVDPAKEMLTPMPCGDDGMAILHRHLIDDHCLTDLILCNSAQRLTPSTGYLEQQIRQARAERDAADKRLAQVSAERDAILASSSWRLSAPLRWFKQQWMALPDRRGANGR